MNLTGQRGRWVLINQLRNGGKARSREFRNRTRKGKEKGRIKIGKDSCWFLISKNINANTDSVTFILLFTVGLVSM